MSDPQTSAPSQGPPLWRLLCFTAQVMLAATRGRSWAQSQSELPPGTKAAVQSLAFACWRNWGQAQALRKLLAPKAPPPEVDALLRTALALISADGEAAYEPHTLVSQAVEAAKSQPRTQHTTSFVNAVLRRFLREREALLSAISGDLEAVHQHPAWWIDRLQTDHPDAWQAICAANQIPGPLVLRFLKGFVPSPKVFSSSDAIKKEAYDFHQPDWQRVGEVAWKAEPAVPVEQIPGFAEGQGMVQDAAAQLAAPLLLADLLAKHPKGQGLRLLDACAAPGGKTAHLMELAPKAQVLALDASAKRLPRIEANLARMKLLGPQVAVKAGDATQPSSWWDGQLFDGILIDAPCSASGIVRRQPDVRWIRKPEEVADLAALQARILASLWPLLKPGGSLVYCTCSVFRAEGEDQAEAFEKHHSDALRLSAPGQLLPQHAGLSSAFQDNIGEAGLDQALPGKLPTDHDGFFFARFQKRSDFAA